MPDRDRHYRSARVRTVQSGFPAAEPLQEHRLCGVLRGSEHAETEKIRPARGDGERGDLGADALSDGDQPICPLPEGYGARQDRQLHGGERRRAVAEPLDPELRQLERERRPGNEGPLSAARGADRGQGDTGPAWVLQRHRPPAPVAAARGADDQHAARGSYPATGIAEIAITAHRRRRRPKTGTATS